MLPAEPGLEPNPATFLTACTLEAAALPRRRKAGARRREKSKGPPPKTWPPPEQDGVLHSLYSKLQTALDEEVEVLPTQKACDLVKAMRHVGSRYQVQTRLQQPRRRPLKEQVVQQQEQQQEQQQRPLLALPSLAMTVPPAPGSDTQTVVGPLATGPLEGPGRAKGRSKTVEDPEIMHHHSPPPIPLAYRAVHPLFLRELLRQGIPSAAIAAGHAHIRSHDYSGGLNGEPSLSSHMSFSSARERPADARWLPGTCTTAELISRCIKPVTAPAHMCLVQAVICGAVPVPWCPEGRFQGSDLEPHLLGRPVYGPATYFVSSAYSYKFEELVAAVLHHYEGLPEVSNGGSASVYYWFSCFAVNLNHGIDLRKNPESQFEVVVQRCRALLLATKPWSAPSALQRTWCLYESMVALNAGVALVALNLELNIPLDTIFADGGITHAVEAFSGALAGLDIRRTHCASRIDHAHLLNMVDRHMGGADQCNLALMQGLQPCLMSALLTLVLKRPRKDYSLAIQLVEEGQAMLQWAPAFVAGPLEGGDTAADFFGSALRSPDVTLSELVLDPCIRPQNPSSSQGLLLTRPVHLLLGQEAGGVVGGARPGRRITQNGAFNARCSAPPSRASTAVPKTPREGSPSKSFTAALASLPATPGAHTTAYSRPGSVMGLHDRYTPAHSSHASPRGALLHERHNSAYSHPSSGAALHERCWTARTDMNTNTRRSLNFVGAAPAPEPEWTLGGWTTSSTLDLDTSVAVVRPQPGASTSAIATSCPSAADVGGGRNANLPKSRTQLKAEDDWRRAQEPPKLMTPTGAAALATALTMNPGGHLVTLALSNNSLGSEGVATLVQALHFNYTLRSLLLRNNDIGADCGKALGQAIGRNTMLTCLDLGDNPLGPSSMLHVAQGLQQSGLRDLRMDSALMETDGACALAKGLAGCTSLVRLDLSRNAIGSSGAWAIASSLRTGNLQCLMLAHNQVGSAGVQALAGALCESGGRTLKMLILRDNDLGLESGASIADILAPSLPLSCLDLSLNPLLGSIGVTCLAVGLKENTTLAELRMTGVNMEASGVAALAEALGTGARSLHRLDISDNPITSDGAEALASYAMTSDTCKLNELHLERCGLTAQGRLALVSSMQANSACTLRHLHLTGNDDPDADPKAGARLERSSGSGSGLVVAAMSKAEQVLAQSLNIGRQLTKTRNLKIYG